MSTINQFKSQVFAVLFAHSLVLRCMCFSIAFDLAQVAVFFFYLVLYGRSSPANRFHLHVIVIAANGKYLPGANR